MTTPQPITPSAAARPKLDNIQVLRAFAALAVVFFHTAYTCPGMLRPIGSFGVDIFFVISGFIMAMICRAESAVFLRKRLIRIVPLYWTLTLIVFASLALHPGLDPVLERTPAVLAKSLFFLPHIRPDGSLLPILVVGWTLNYELCFYLFLTLALLFTKKHPALLASVLLIFFMLAMRLLPSSTASSFYGRPILLEFVAGILAYHLDTFAPAPRCIALRPLLLAFIPLAIAALVLVQARDLHRLPTALTLGLPAFLLVQSAVLLSKSGLDARWPLPVLLGDASYSLYLTHPFVISAFKRLVGTHAPALAPDRLLGMLAVLVLASAVSVAVHLTVDRPLYRYLNRRLTRKPSKERTSQSPALLQR